MGNLCTSKWYEIKLFTYISTLLLCGFLSARPRGGGGRGGGFGAKGGSGYGGGSRPGSLGGASRGGSNGRMASSVSGGPRPSHSGGMRSVVGSYGGAQPRGFY